MFVKDSILRIVAGGAHYLVQICIGGIIINTNICIEAFHNTNENLVASKKIFSILAARKSTAQTLFSKS